LHEFLLSKNPNAAARAAAAILDGADFLGANPLVGRPMRDETDRREWFVVFGAGAYVLRYVVEPEVAGHANEGFARFSRATKLDGVWPSNYT
jgi:plasmid stabilization system protein ParE